MRRTVDSPVHQFRRPVRRPQRIRSVRVAEKESCDDAERFKQQAYVAALLVEPRKMVTVLICEEVSGAPQHSVVYTLAHRRLTQFDPLLLCLRQRLFPQSAFTPQMPTRKL